VGSQMSIYIHETVAINLDQLHRCWWISQGWYYK